MTSCETSSAATKSGRPSAALVPAKSLAGPSTPAAVPAKLAGQCQPVPSGQPIHIALVDDDPIIHAAMHQTFKAWAANWTLDSYLDGNRAIDCITQAPPHAVLMDITMPEMTGIECAKKIKALLPDLPVVMFSARTDADSFISSMIAGASGYMLKPSSPSDTISAIKKTLEGFPALCTHSEVTIIQWLHSLGENVSSWGLSAREQEVMLQLCSNRRDKDIARLLEITPSTVHAHLYSIYKKLGVGNRNEARQKFLILNSEAEVAPSKSV